MLHLIMKRIGGALSVSVSGTAGDNRQPARPLRFLTLPAHPQGAHAKETSLYIHGGNRPCSTLLEQYTAGLLNGNVIMRHTTEMCPTRSVMQSLIAPNSRKPSFFSLFDACMASGLYGGDGALLWHAWPDSP